MNKCIIDANVVLLPGMAVKDIPEEQLECAKKCSSFLEKFMKDSHSRLVLDQEGRILKEYRNAFSYGNEQGIAVEFYKWVNLMILDCVEDIISLKEIQENEFENYPNSCELKNFDPADRKYIALAYSHPDKPPIIEASDSKWWGIQEAMKANGMEICFIDEKYIQMKYKQKMES